MSFAVDANILLYASDTGSPFHQRAAEFLRQRVGGAELFCLGWPTLMSYLRIATHTRIFANPLTPAAAVANVESLLSLPNVRVLGEGERFWECYGEVTHGVVVRGQPDARRTSRRPAVGARCAGAVFQRHRFREVLGSPRAGSFRILKHRMPGRGC